MIATFIILVPLLLICLFLFFRLSPKQAESNKVIIYNLGTIGAIVVSCALYSLNMRDKMINTSDSAWWSVLAVMFSSVITIGVLFLSGIIRNLIIFRKKG